MIRPCPACGHPVSRIAQIVRTDTFGDRRDIERRECTACGMVFVHPLPTDAELHALYASPRYYALTATEPVDADGLRERPAWKRVLYDRILDEIGRRVPAPARILDVGCGWGLFLECATARGFRAEGLDLSAEVVAYVTGTVRLPARVAALDTAEPGAHDVVTMLDVFEHVRDPGGFAVEALRALRPGGWLVVHVPRWGGLSSHLLHRLLVRLRRQEPLEFLQHLSEFRPGSLRRILRQAGFTDIAVLAHENAGRHDVKPPLRRIAWKAISALGRAAGRSDALIGLARRPA